jgi:hypothetical protein
MQAQASTGKQAQESEPGQRNGEQGPWKSTYVSKQNPIKEMSERITSQVATSAMV